MKRVMLAALAVIVLSGCDNRPDAPFGFKWGQSVEEIKKLNLKDLNCSEDHKEAACITETSPKDKSKDNTYILEFTENNGLNHIINIRSYSKYALVDVKKIFEKVNNQIKDEYGESVKINGKSYEKEYFSCMSNEKCNEFKTIYKRGDITVTLYLDDNIIAIQYAK